MQRLVWDKIRGLIAAAAAYLLGWTLPVVGVGDMVVPWIVAIGSFFLSVAVLTDDLVTKFFKCLKFPKWLSITIIVGICLAATIGMYCWSHNSILQSEREASQKQAMEQAIASGNPDVQTIRTATATVNIIAKSDENVHGYDLGSGGYMTLVTKDNVVLLLTYAAEDQRNQQGNGRVRYTGVFNMDATSIFAKNTIAVLKQADYAQIGFSIMPKDTEILEGSNATIIINSNIRFDIPIPPQTVTDLPTFGVPTAIFVRNIEPYLTDSK
jgi:hypothetical protein